MRPHLIRRPARLTLAAITTVLVASGCDDEKKPLAPYPGEELSGGDTTVFDTTADAFSRSARNLTTEERQRFFVGNSFFNDPWVTAPASTAGRDGLGPTFNADSCSACHFKDGRGRPPEADEDMTSMLVRLSIPGTDAHGGPKPDPTYGGQLQPRAILGVPAEGLAKVTYTPVAGEYADGTAYELLEPTYTFEMLAFGPLPDDLMISPRVAPAVHGLGLLEAVPEATLRELADPDDADGDGISGRINTVWDPIAEKMVVGRFGWKANQPGLRQQDAGAFLGDMGITSSLNPDDNCPAAQSECAAAPNGSTDTEAEADQKAIDRVTFYTQTLAVPARRDVDDPEVLAGRAHFEDLGCGGCHVPTMQTGTLEGVPAVSDQTIWPYTDLLLHDMGEALADGRPDYDASGTEWRTPPLWGIGLLENVNGHERLLHDGRARGFEEAVLWHGGEAQAARDAFVALDADDRAQLIRFLRSI